MMRSRLRSNFSATPLSRPHFPRMLRASHSLTSPRSQLPLRPRLRVVLSRPPPPRATISLSSHSRRAPLLSFPSRISSFRRRARMPPLPRLTLPLLLRLRPSRAPRRLPQSLLAKKRRLLAKSHLRVLRSRRPLRRSSSTLPARVARKRLLKSPLRNLQLVERNRLPPCPHQVARSLPRPLIR